MNKRSGIWVIVASIACAVVFYSLLKHDVPPIPDLPAKPSVQAGLEGYSLHRQATDRMLAEFEEKMEKVRDANLRVTQMTLAIAGIGVVVGIVMFAGGKSRVPKRRPGNSGPS